MDNNIGIKLDPSINHRLSVPIIKRDYIPKKFDLFFYEYAKFKGIDTKEFEITREEFKNKLNFLNKEFYSIRIFDEISIIDSKNYIVKLNFYHIKEYQIKISDEIFKKFNNNLSLKGIITLELDATRNLLYISSFEEWKYEIDLDSKYLYEISSISTPNKFFLEVLKSCNFDPAKLLFREKICILARLLPLVQKNFNIIELTIPQVGKSYLYDHLFTDKTSVKKVSDLTNSNLFSSINSENGSILRTNNVLCIDEFHKGKFEDIIPGLQTFMENGIVSRGNKPFKSEASVIMYANFKEKNSQYKMFVNPEKYRLFSDTPHIDEPFLQRINYFNPSFGMRPLQDSFYLKKNEQRIATTYMEELFKVLREEELNLDEIFSIQITNNGVEIPTRLFKSIIKTASGFIKLLFPNLLSKLKNNSCIDIDYHRIDICFFLALESASLYFHSVSITNCNLKLTYDNREILLTNINLYSNVIKKIENLNYNISVETPHCYVTLENGFPFNNKSYHPLDIFGVKELQLANRNFNLLQKYSYNKSSFLSFKEDILTTNLSEVDNFLGSQLGLFFCILNTNKLFGYNITNGLSFGHLSGTIIYEKQMIFTCPYCKEKFYIDRNFFIGKDVHQNPLYSSLKNFSDTGFSIHKCGNSLFLYDLFPDLFTDLITK